MHQNNYSTHFKWKKKEKNAEIGEMDFLDIFLEGKEPTSTETDIKGRIFFGRESLIGTIVILESPPKKQIAPKKNHFCG